MKDVTIGVDLAKSVFQVHGATMTGEVLFRRRLPRGQFLCFMAGHPPAIVVLEACGGAHHWARELARQGHEVKLIAPQYVRPFVKRQKNDAADAEAIVVAAQRPEMRFVEPKNPDQQARAILFRARERLVHHRTELVNALRAVLYEFGQIVPLGIANVRRLEALVQDTDLALPHLVREECCDLLAQIAEKSARIETKAKTIADLARQSDVARRLQTMPGIGPMTALAVEAFAPAMTTFRCGRDFAAWLGLVPRQFSSGARTGSAGCRKPDKSTSAGS